MTTLNELNMQFRSDLTDYDYQEWDGSLAIIPCRLTWTKNQIEEWTGDLDFDSVETVLQWAKDAGMVSCGGCVKIWKD